MNFRLWLAYALLDLGLCLTPGPAVLTVVSQAIRHGGRRSAFGALGISTGNLVYFTLSALGLGAFVATSPRVYAGLRWSGIAYLGYTALRLLVARSGPGEGIASAEGSPRALFGQGVATQLSNPKAMVFFASILVPFIDPAAPWPIPAQLAVFAATTTATELPILLAYGHLASHGGALLRREALGRWQDRLAGTCLLAVAAWLGLRG